MNFSNLCIRHRGLLTLSVALLAAHEAMAVTINIDFGRSDQTTAGNFNNVVPDEGSNSLPTATWPLIDDTGAATGFSLETDSPGSFAGTGVNYGGPYPTEISGLPQSALQDSLFIRSGDDENPAITTLVLDGLSSAETYDFLFYGARGGVNGDAQGQSLYTITGGNGTFPLSIANILNNSSDVATATGVAADSNGQILIDYQAIYVEGTSGLINKTGALNLLVITSNPGGPGVAGDFNGDLVVDAADYAVWRNGFGVDYDIDDYNTWRSAYGTGTSTIAAAAPAPEPATLWLLGGVVAAISVQRKRRSAQLRGASDC